MVSTLTEDQSVVVVTVFPLVQLRLLKLMAKVIPPCTVHHVTVKLEYRDIHDPVTAHVSQFILTLTPVSISLPVKLSVTIFHDFASDGFVLSDSMCTRTNCGLSSNDVKCATSI